MSYQKNNNGYGAVESQSSDDYREPSSNKNEMSRVKKLVWLAATLAVGVVIGMQVNTAYSGRFESDPLSDNNDSNSVETKTSAPVVVPDADTSDEPTEEDIEKQIRAQSERKLPFP